jgi:hypothetical protein
MVSKKAQSKAGIPARRRGQQMGDERSAKDKTPDAKQQTPALSGGREEANKFFADESSQHVGGGGEAPSATSPSLPAALPTGEPLGQSGGERAFKKRQGAKAKGRKGERGRG